MLKPFVRVGNESNRRLCNNALLHCFFLLWGRVSTVSDGQILSALRNVSLSGGANERRSRNSASGSGVGASVCLATIYLIDKLLEDFGNMARKML